MDITAGFKFQRSFYGIKNLIINLLIFIVKISSVKYYVTVVQHLSLIILHMSIEKQL